jgi:TetR/AcrR family transcriptional regulator, transcriptional repressor for nem operon
VLGILLYEVHHIKGRERMRYAAEHKVRTKAKMLTEATRAIRLHGPSGLRVEQVMSRAGLTHGGFYAHFPSREHLVAEAVAEALKQGAALFERVTHDRSPREALRAYINYYLSPEHLVAVEAGCPLPAMIGDLPRVTSEARERFGQGFARLHKRVETLMVAAGVEDASVGASSLIAELVGAVSLARALVGPEQTVEVLTRSRLAIYKRVGLEDA